MLTMLKVLAAICLVCVVRAAPAEALSISLAVPSGARGREIDATGPKPFFHVILTNGSTSPHRIWQEKCSWGYYALHFEITDGGGRTFVMRKQRVSFTRNFPAGWTLEPGEQLPVDVHLGDARTWGQPDQLSRGCAPVRLRVVLEVTPDTESARFGAWTGRVSSEEKKVTLCR